jgi:hypothetical protein
MVDAHVGGLAEEERQKAGASRRPFQFVDNAAEQHRLALAWVALNPEQEALRIVAPPSEISVVEDLAVQVRQQAALGLLNACLVVARIGRPQLL